MNKKILVLCNHNIVLYNFKKELIKALKEEGFDIYISMPFDNSLNYFENELKCKCFETQVDRRGLNPLKDLKLFRKYNHLIKIIKPDLIFAMTIKPTIYGGICSRIHRINFITNITGIGTTFQNNSLLKKVIISLYKKALHNCKACFFENEENKKIFLEYGIVNEKQAITVKGAGVNLNEFRIQPQVKKDCLVFSFVGRVMKEKGIDEFLYCVEKLKAKKDIEFRVYGFCEDDYLKQLKKLEKNENFKYYGFVKDMKKVYKESDVIVLPSYHEGMSNVLLEAAACGDVIITTNIYGCKEAVDNGKTGFLIRKKNKEELLECIKFISKMNYNDIKEMGVAAREKMVIEFDREKINQIYLKTINDKF